MIIKIRRFIDTARSILAATGTLGAARKIHSQFRPPRSPQGADSVSNEREYLARVSAEIATFDNIDVVHDLPPIFHYWSNKYLLALIKPFGFIHPDDFFIKQLAKVMDTAGAGGAVFISIGAGNCDTELRVAQGLIALGHENFVIECLDLNPSMLARGRDLAKEHGMERHIRPLEGDFNQWRAAKPYHAVMANQSLHHVMQLEHLFDAILDAIKPLNGVLITSDMIGRNGHQRWPEALSLLEEYWDELPPKYKYNRQLKRQDAQFVNWDCATDGFEGIRAQDIMRLLSERFHFDLFVPFANLITPFIDRGFGHNFDIDSEFDRSFIDRVHARDEVEIRAGRISPTQMFAVLSSDWSRPTQCIDGLTPGFCTRKVEAA